MLLLAACKSAELPISPPTTTPADTATAVTTVYPSQINRRVDVPKSISFGLTLPKDAIHPIYQPQFVSADDAPFQDAELIMGVTFDDEAKAYPVSVLRFREMVNDELAGIPILVSW